MKQMIYRKIGLVLFGWLTVGTHPGFAQAPLLQDLEVGATATLDATTGIFTYRYAVTNGAVNTHDIGIIGIDITRPVGSFLPSEEGLVHEDRVLREFGDEMLELLRIEGIETIPVGINALSPPQSPGPWLGDFGPRGDATWLGTRAGIPSGASLAGFQITSHGVPGIRNFEAVADTAPEEFPATEDPSITRAFVDSTFFRTQTLGPSAEAPGSFGHWDHLRDELNRAIELGWIPDAGLANALVTQLANAREALDARDGTLAKTRLQPILDVLAQTTAAQRRQEAHDLVLLNVQGLIQNTEDTPVPFEPQASLTPQDQKLSLGEQYTLTATLINLGDKQPIASFPLSFEVIDGPHAGQRFDGATDQQGKIRFGFNGEALGRDRIRLFQEGELITEFGEAKVEWTGGPDLVVPFFIPPLIQGEGGGTLFVTERTANLGNVPSAPSITRYYFSGTEPIDPATALALGKRAVPSLQPGEEQGEASPLQFTLPIDLSSNHYFMAACADAPAQVVELNEENNCSFNDVPGKTFVIPMEGSPNTPPDCTSAFPSVARIWPPNHRLVTIHIQGVTDPEGDPIALRIQSITQDEAVNGLGDGDTAPDGFGIGASSA